MTARAEERTAAPAPGVDGRSAIRDRNREAVLDAVLDLFSEDNLSPGPEEVALRVGLSVRSVYRYFDDHDTLTRAAIARNIERRAPYYRKFYECGIQYGQPHELRFYTSAG